VVHLTPAHPTPSHERSLPSLLGLAGRFRQLATMRTEAWALEIACIVRQECLTRGNCHACMGPHAQDGCAGDTNAQPSYTCVCSTNGGVGLLQVSRRPLVHMCCL
jgi:hypothetical protein